MFQVSISKLSKNRTLEHGTLGKNRVIPYKNNQVLHRQIPRQDQNQPKKYLAKTKTPLKYN
ncbi:hypothetical protein EB001_12210 [bacterium]|nr:hypothetical protein [bacterium]